MKRSPKTKVSKVQATNVTYELHTMGWKAFQSLCVSILGELWGQTIQTFFDSHDAGRDGAFAGVWRAANGASFEGTFVVQCKFSAKRDKQIDITDLADELEKAKTLAAKGLSNNYFLLTNARLTGTSELKIKKVFEAVEGIRTFVAYGEDRICQLIRESSRLRMLVPRIYGLGDLSQILDERAQDQAKEILSALGGDLTKFVITESYQQSVKALCEHGFVLLLGEPACGKSTIAAALALGALDLWGCSTFKIRNANDFVIHSNPNETKQFFWVDDAFGATQFEWAPTVAWNTTFQHIHAAIRRGGRVLFTSRDYIYQSARAHLKESALPVFRESQVVIKVEQLSRAERDQILYNHIKLGSQNGSFKKGLKPFLPEIAAHSHFSPETARRLGNPLFTKTLVLAKTSLNEFVEHPIDFLCEVIRTIDVESRAALSIIFMRGGSLPSPIEMSKDESAALLLMGGTPTGVRTALKAMTDSLVILTVHNADWTWRFKHPTIRDALAIAISEDRELLDIYLHGAPIQRLFEEITCGDVGMPGVKVIVPADRYKLIIKRLSSIESNDDGATRLHRFLSSRCNCEFLSCFIKSNPSFISGLKVWSFLNVVSDIDVLIRLHEFGLLPEEKRLYVFREVKELAISIPDHGFLNIKMRKMFTTEELASIFVAVKDTLLPNIDQTIDDWASNYDRHDKNNDPSYHFEDLLSALNAYKDELSNDAGAVSIIRVALRKIDELIDYMRADAFEPDQDDMPVSTPQVIKDSSRSIFDDVDE